MSPKISLEQWRALVAVVEAGGYAHAAEVLHKTQSSVSYGVQKLERLLDVKVFEIDGRRARLTANGQVLYRRARALLEEAESLERASANLAAGWEPELRIAAEIIYPTWMLLKCFARFAEQRPETRIQLFETVLAGTDEALTERRVHLAINSRVPPGFMGIPLINMRFVPAAHPDHPLHKLGRELVLDDLRQHRHLVIRDTGVQARDSGIWQGSEQRWTVSHKATSIHAAVMGLGFAWFAEDTIRDELERGVLKPLPMRDGGERYAQLYLILAEGDASGPGARLMAEIISGVTQSTCTAAANSDGGS